MQKFDFETLTLDEIETIEQVTGSDIGTAFADGKPKGKALKVFIWVMTKRTNPDFKIEDAGKLSLKDALAAIEGIDEKKVE